MAGLPVTKEMGAIAYIINEVLKKEATPLSRKVFDLIPMQKALS